MCALNLIDSLNWFSPLNGFMGAKWRLYGRVERMVFVICAASDGLFDCRGSKLVFMVLEF